MMPLMLQHRQSNRALTQALADVNCFTRSRLYVIDKSWCERSVAQMHQKFHQDIYIDHRSSSIISMQKYSQYSTFSFRKQKFY
jgi:hypothetical protein